MTPSDGQDARPPPKSSGPAPSISRLRQRPRGSVRLRTLVVLRWLAIVGQTAAILFVHFGLGFALPFGLCLAAILISAWLNIFSALQFSAGRVLSEREAGIYLAFDIIQLSALLLFTGGIQNPFTLLFIAPVTISASVLSLRATLALSGLAFACITLLSFVYFPLPWSGSGADGFMLPGVYLIGIWASLVLGIGFTGAYAWRVAQERADMSNALAATQLVLAREQRLSALGGLAAAAAHELGTPLATIQLVAKEMARELSPSSPLAEDAQLLLSQSVRCREILGRLSSRGEEGDLVHGRMTLKGLLEEAATPHREGARIIIRTSGRPGASEPVVARQPEMLYGLSNLIENAVDFAESQVTLQAFWDENQVQITVQDDGPGFSADVIQRLGEPYVTTRGASLRGDTAKHPRGEYGGLGLGFFIAKTLLERTGARLRLNGPSEDAKGAARTPPATVGARVDIVWNRLSIEAPPTSSPKAKTARPASEGDETAA